MSEKSFRLFENMIVTRVIPFVSIFIAMAYSHQLGINYYVNILGGLDRNEFQLN